MKQFFSKILMSLSVASLISSCSSPKQSKLILIDISGSNASNISKTLNKVNEIYLESGPNDYFEYSIQQYLFAYWMNYLFW